MHRRDFALGLVAGLCSCGERSPAPSAGSTSSLDPAPSPSPVPEPRPPRLDAPPPARITPDALAARAELLQRRHAGREFTVRVEPPFVVVGDEAPLVVERRCERQIRWSVRWFKQNYFSRDPEQINDIYLFADEDSYVRNTREIFGEEPDTPYGYYSPKHDALIMNIGTGGGTLVHEIVHPFIAADFPACPAWFNEGLASLYERCGERFGRIVGHTNWRLPELQAAIRGRRLGSIAALCAATSERFYGARRGLHYAQARYLCYYLQERRLLRDYYHAFRAAADRDHGGYSTLLRLVGHDDTFRLEREWRRFVLALRLG